MKTFEHANVFVPMGGDLNATPKLESPEFRKMQREGWMLVGWAPRPGYTNCSCVFVREKPAQAET